MAQREFDLQPDIIVPPMKGGTESATHEHVVYIREILLSDLRWSEGGFQAVCNGLEVVDALDGKSYPGVIQLREPLWEILRDCVDKPKFPGGGSIHPHLARALKPFMAAIRDARRVEKKIDEKIDEKK